MGLNYPGNEGKATRICYQKKGAESLHPPLS